MEGVGVGVCVGVGGRVGVLELLLLLLLDGRAGGQTDVLPDDDVAGHAHLTHGRGAGGGRRGGGHARQHRQVQAPWVILGCGFPGLGLMPWLRLRGRHVGGSTPL